MSTSTLPPVVILDIEFGGYGLGRSLAPYPIPLIAFSKGAFDPAQYSRHLDRLVKYKGEQDLLDQLKRVAQQSEQKPVLILTTDDYVSFVDRHREAIESLFQIDFPDKSVVHRLLDKSAFPKFAEEHQFLIPRTEVINGQIDVAYVREHFDFPIIIKPHQRSESWQKSSFTKVLYVASYDELVAVYQKIFEVEPRVVLQEWIPGADQNIFFCLVYFDQQGDCLAHFCGQKWRQWPQGSGTGSVLAPVEDEHVVEETLRLFKAANYRGFGSVEFKRHDWNGKYYIIEPTTGRIDGNEYVATANGINLPLIAYNSLTGQQLSPVEKQQPVVYVDEFMELKRVVKKWMKGSFSVPFGKKKKRNKKAYRFLTIKDPLVSVMLLFKIFDVFFQNLKKN
jgi:predicted ATP-grasp superfamily ATP-dependent carboligase